MLQWPLAALVCVWLTAPAVAQQAAAPREAAPLALREMGSFHVGGRKVEVTGQPVKEIVRVAGGPTSKLDLNGTYHVEHMYAQYFLVQNRKGKWPILIWHGGGLTGATYETTPDGREGWRDMLLRKGWDTYVTDATERGRSGFAGPVEVMVARNAVQFQKGLDMAEFNRRYGTEDQCRAALDFRAPQPRLQRPDNGRGYARGRGPRCTAHDVRGRSGGA